MSNILRANAKVILYKSKQLADGTHPVMLKITFKGQRKYYGTGFNMAEETFEQLSSKKRLSREDSKIQTQLASIEVRARGMIDRIIEDKRSFSFVLFEKAFFVTTTNTDVYRLFQERIDYYDNKGGYSTRESFKNALAHFKSYMGKRKLLLEDITDEYLLNYEKAHPHLSPNTLGIYERNLRVIFNQAIHNGVISQDTNPFLKHRIPFRPGRKKALVKEDIMKVLNFQSVLHSTEWLSQQLFIFSYLCNGLNLKDIVNLRWADISDGRIYFIRAKTINTAATPRMQSIKVTQHLKHILDDLKYYKTSESDFVFPVLKKNTTDEQRYRRKNDFSGVINDNMRKIAKKVGIKKDFTFYSARHSWATILKRAGVSVEIISEGMSHSSLRVTQVYLDSFGDDEMDRANEHLL